MNKEESNHKFARIQELLEIAKEQELLYDEFLQDVELENLVPTREVEKIIEVERPLKCSEKQLQYAKDYREYQKELKKETEEQAKRKAKIEKALKRKKIYCHKCQQQVFVRHQDSTYEIRNRRNRKKPTILIKNVCLKCDSIITAYGGYLV